VGRDPRVTRVGGFLRARKIDELPQLLNVLKGEMTLVGPRPEVPQYVEFFRADYEEILEVRPGLTDPASLKYRDEAAILSEAADPEREYLDRLLPDKIRLGKEYVRASSFRYDLSLMTLFTARTGA
jgi:lipopolysaccharide/colanic/teichoic acid biosynthesis glycosyltransferase